MQGTCGGTDCTTGPGLRVQQLAARKMVGAFRAKVHQRPVILQLKRRNQLLPWCGQPHSQRLTATRAAFAVLPIRGQEDAMSRAWALRFGCSSQHIAGVAKVLKSRRLGSSVQGTCVDVLFAFELFSKAFDSVQGGRTNSFTRHDSSPGS
ncbi:hypothetical protein D3C85_1188620 [compost metagenome]